MFCTCNQHLHAKEQECTWQSIAHSHRKYNYQWVLLGNESRRNKLSSCAWRDHSVTFLSRQQLEIRKPNADAPEAVVACKCKPCARPRLRAHCASPGLAELHDGGVGDLIKDLADSADGVQLLGGKQLLHIRLVEHGLGNIMQDTGALVRRDVLRNKSLLQDEEHFTPQ
eukprot:scaffold31837_cov16-Tisochrysis_lutea.AAC.1